MFELGFSKKYFFHVLSSSKFNIDGVAQHGIEKRIFFNDDIFSLSFFINENDDDDVNDDDDDF